MDDDSRLIDVASAVADGSGVDWGSVEDAAGDDRSRSIVRELQVLSRMTHAMRESPAPSSSAGSGPAPDIGVGELWGHLRISQAIGRGSFGSVYRAWDTRLECEVALKLIKSSGVSRAFDLARSIKEARLLARVSHRNVVRVFGADSHDDRFGIWMEFVSGRTLEQVLAVHGPMSPGEATLVGIDLCHAIAAVHGAGLLHRDIKAHNVLREGGGRIVLMDFGTGRDLARTGDVTDVLAGTPLYLAPELFGGRQPSHASDLYSLGVLLYHLVTGSYPTPGKSRREVELAHQHGQRRPLRDARPDLTPAFVDVVERALAPNPQNRYSSAGEFGNALAGVAGIPYGRDVPSARRHKWAAAAALATVLTVLAIAGFSRLVRDRADSATAVPGAPPASTAASGAAGTVVPYKVAASFYAVRNGQDVRLTEGSRVAPGDKLYATVEASQPVYVYVVNRDDAGQSYLLFPLPEYSPANPIPLNQTNRLPGSRDGQQHHWEVTSAGSREHFLIYVTPRRLVDFEQMLAALPRAEFGRPVINVPLSTSAIGILRGVGGIAPGENSQAGVNNAELAELRPLPDRDEMADGVWARKISFENPSR